MRYATCNTIIKERTIYQIRQAMTQKNFHHHVTFYVNTTQWLIQSNDKRGKQISPSIVRYPMHQKKELFHKHLKPAIHNILLQQELEEKAYYHYHPTMARKLALAYLQEQNVKDHFFLPNGNKYRKQQLYQTKQQEKSIPLCYQETIIPNDRKQEDDRPLTKDKDEKERYMEKIELQTLVKAVYKEVERKRKQEQMRKGRYSQ